MVMSLRYSPIPVVVAPHTMSLGGACEMSMHADCAMATAETYIGLVEVGVGLLPGGAGTKELALRVSDEFQAGDVEVNVLQKYFLLAAQAKVATSAHEAFDMGILQRKKDRVSINKARQLYDARQAVLDLHEAGYVQPLERTNVRVLGRTGLGVVLAGTAQMQYAGYASAHDKLIADKIGYVMCGGDLSEASEVSERYLLDLEREAFLQLLGTKETLERINHMLTTGKPLRN
jgi:3-hydroxyacyl-CoA dehydrogenase